MEELNELLHQSQEDVTKRIGILLLQEIASLRKEILAQVAALTKKFDCLLTKLNMVLDIESDCEQDDSVSSEPMSVDGSLNTAEILENITSSNVVVKLERYVPEYGDNVNALFPLAEECEENPLETDEISALGGASTLSDEAEVCGDESPKTVQILVDEKIETPPKNKKLRLSSVSKKTQMKYKEDETDMLQCGVCGKHFNSLGHLKRHIGTHELTSCPHCFEIMNKSELNVHLRKHANKKSYKCGDCGKYFSLIGNLHLHQRRHAKHKAFACEICGKRFAAKGDMKRHMLLHGEKTEKCPICGKLFYRKDEIGFHIKVHLKDKNKE